MTSPEGFLLRYIIPSTMRSISPRRIIQLHPDILDDLGGKYKSNELDVVVPVFREGDKLYTRTSFWDKVELSPESETHFFGNSKNIGEFQLEFIRDKAGEVQRAIAYFQLREVQFDKIQ